MPGRPPRDDRSAASKGSRREEVTSPSTRGVAPTRVSGKGLPRVRHLPPALASSIDEEDLLTFLSPPPEQQQHQQDAPLFAMRSPIRPDSTAAVMDARSSAVHSAERQSGTSQHRAARHGTVLSLSGLGSTTADFVTQMERLAQEELAGLWRRLSEGMQSEAALQAALDGPRTEWNPYRPARGGANLRQEILNSQLVEFKKCISTDALHLRGIRLLPHGAKAPTGATPPRTSPVPSSLPDEEVFAAQGYPDMTVWQRDREADARRARPPPSAHAPAQDAALEEALFVRVWKEVAVPGMADLLMDLVDVLGSSTPSPRAEEATLSGRKTLNSPPPPQVLLNSTDAVTRVGSNGGTVVADTAPAASRKFSGGSNTSRPHSKPAAVDAQASHKPRHGSAPHRRDDSATAGFARSETTYGEETRVKSARPPTTCDDGRPPSHPFTHEISPLPLSQLRDSMQEATPAQGPHPHQRKARGNSWAAAGTPSSHRGSLDEEEGEMFFEDVQDGSSVAASPKRKASSRQTTGRRAELSPASSAPSTTRSQATSSVTTAPPPQQTQLVMRSENDVARYYARGVRLQGFGGSEEEDHGDRVLDDSTGHGSGGPLWETRPGTTNSLLSPNNQAAMEAAALTHFGAPSYHRRRTANPTLMRNAAPTTTPTPSGGNTAFPSNPPAHSAAKTLSPPPATTEEPRDAVTHSNSRLRASPAPAPSVAQTRATRRSPQQRRPFPANTSARTDFGKSTTGATRRTTAKEPLPSQSTSGMSTVFAASAGAASTARAPLYTAPMLQRFAPYTASGVGGVANTSLTSMGVASTGATGTHPHGHHPSPLRNSGGVASARGLVENSSPRTRRAGKSLAGTRLDGAVSPFPRPHPREGRMASPTSLSARPDHSSDATASSSSPMAYLSPERRHTAAKRHHSPLPLPRAPTTHLVVSQSHDAASMADVALASSYGRGTKGGRGSPQATSQPRAIRGAKPATARWQRSPARGDPGDQHPTPPGAERDRSTEGTTVSARNPTGEPGKLTTMETAAAKKKPRPTTAYL